jgi:hypothetical protein
MVSEYLRAGKKFRDKRHTGSVNGRNPDFLTTHKNLLTLRRK